MLWLCSRGTTWRAVRPHAQLVGQDRHNPRSPSLQKVSQGTLQSGTSYTSMCSWAQTLGDLVKMHFWIQVWDAAFKTTSQGVLGSDHTVNCKGAGRPSFLEVISNHQFSPLKCPLNRSALRTSHSTTTLGFLHSYLHTGIIGCVLEVPVLLYKYIFPP